MFANQSMFSLASCAAFGQDMCCPHAQHRWKYTLKTMQAMQVEEMQVMQAEPMEAMKVEAMKAEAMEVQQAHDIGVFVMDDAT